MAGVMKLIANYFNTNDDDMALHLIFSTLVEKHEPFTVECVIANLFRLLVLEGWEPARTYLVMMTGTRVLEEDESEVTYFIDPYTTNMIVLHADSILEVCHTIGGPLCDLQFGEDVDDDDEEETDYDETDEEDEDSANVPILVPSDEEDAEEVAESSLPYVPDDLVDPRETDLQFSKPFISLAETTR